MPPSPPQESFELRSLITRERGLALSLVSVSPPAPAANEVVIRVEASPVNPSDLGLLLGPADPARAVARGSGTEAVLEIPLDPAQLGPVAARVGQSLPVGNEGAGTVIAAGSAPEAQALVGRTVGFVGGGSYARIRVLPAALVLPFPPGTKPATAASWFVNPMTALGMVETMQREGHSALVHTAAASNLGQMLLRLCRADGIPLVCVVRRGEQAALLRGLGATRVCDSSAPDFRTRLVDALAETGATLGFDATGGGPLAGQILSAMEAAQLRQASGFNRYGSPVHKQVYLYGRLDRSPTVLPTDLGMAWGLGGWLLPPFLAKIGPEATGRLRERVAREIGTTFASRYAAEIPLAALLDPDRLRACARQATGEKLLINPQLPATAHD
ncbi:MAG: zinc-binding dehydrogenase [Myxococcota bacterium]